jgi:hypothetical protein
MQFLPTKRRFRAAVKQRWVRFVTAARPHHRFAIARRSHASRQAIAPTAASPSPNPSPSIDPVALTVLAVNRLGPATLRTVANGKPLTVTVPNERIGEIFRAALAEMQKHRRTDRLIDIVIARDAVGAASEA